MGEVLPLIAFIDNHGFALFFVILAGTASLLGGKSFVAARAKRRRKREWMKRQADIRALQALDCWEFEILAGEVLRVLGYRVKDNGGGGADGGIDHRVFKGGWRGLAQSKHYGTKPVGVKPVRELAGVVMRENAHGGILITSGKFTRSARKEAAGLPLRLIDGAALLRIIQNQTAQSV